MTASEGHVVAMNRVHVLRPPSVKMRVPGQSRPVVARLDIAPLRLGATRQPTRGKFAIVVAYSDFERCGAAFFGPERSC